MVQDPILPSGAIRPCPSNTTVEPISRSPQCCPACLCCPPHLPYSWLERWDGPCLPGPDGPQGGPATQPGESLGPPAPWQFFSFSYPFFHFSLIYFTFSCVSAFREYLCLISLKAGSAGAFRCLMKQTWTSGIFHTAWALPFYWKLSTRLFFPPYFHLLCHLYAHYSDTQQGWVGCKPKTRWQISLRIWRKGEMDWRKG